MVMNSLIINLIALLRRISSLKLIGGTKLWITTASLAFVVFSLITNFSEIKELSFDRYSYLWIFLGIAISSLSLLVNSIAWKSLINWLGNNSDNVDFINLFLTTNLLKYLPGGIWHFVERLRRLRSHMAIGKALTSVLLEPILMLVAALVLVPLGELNPFFSVGFFAPLLLLTPKFREPLLRRLETIKIKELNRADLSLFNAVKIDQIEITRSGYPWRPLLIEIMFLLCRFWGFWCCLSAFSIDSSLSLGKWISAFSLAWAVGLIVPAAPGGLGVFEASLLIGIGNYLSEAPLIGAVLSYRLTSTISDVLVAFVSTRVGMKRLSS